MKETTQRPEWSTHHGRAATVNGCQLELRAVLAEAHALDLAVFDGVDELGVAPLRPLGERVLAARRLDVGRSEASGLRELDLLHLLRRGRGVVDGVGRAREGRDQSDQGRRGKLGHELFCEVIGLWGWTTRMRGSRTASKWFSLVPT